MRTTNIMQTKHNHHPAVKYPTPLWAQSDPNTLPTPVPVLTIFSLSEALGMDMVKKILREQEASFSFGVPLGTELLPGVLPADSSLWVKLGWG